MRDKDLPVNAGLAVAILLERTTESHKGFVETAQGLLWTLTVHDYLRLFEPEGYMSAVDNITMHHWECTGANLTRYGLESCVLDDSAPKPQAVFAFLATTKRRE